MRLFVISCCFLAVAGAGPGFASADVIRLKSGDVIYADQVTDGGDSIQYEVGDNSYTIPKSKVLKVEAGVRSENGTAQQVDTPTFFPQTHLRGESELLEQIVHDHGVDRSAIAELESSGNAAQTAIAYYIAGKFEYEAGKYADARRDLETAVRFDPRNPAVLNYYAALLVRTGNPLDAITYAGRAAEIAPDSADVFAVLGFAQFAADRSRDAIQSWKKSLTLRPDASIQQLIARAERESGAENNYTRRETEHFILRFEGKQSSEGFREQLLSTLESDYQELEREFGSAPRSSVQVVMYTNEAFFDLTRAPTWTAALNDGKLRIPLQGLTSVTPELARVLRHELTHSFVNQLSMGRCPQWINEGVAQLLEPRTLGGRAARLAELFRLEREIPFNSLESGFGSFSSSEATLAYDESLAAVEYIRNRYGMSDLLRIMQRLAGGESTEAALRSVLHCDYGHLQDEVRDYLSAQP